MIRETQLLLYKGRPARVKRIQGDDRIEIETLAGELKKVRPKDIVALHPGPVADLGDLERPIDTGELEAAWELLHGADTVTLVEMMSSQRTLQETLDVI